MPINIEDVVALMDDIFEAMNNIDDSASLPQAVLLKTALDGAIIVVTDDARTYDIQRIVDEFSKDHVDEDEQDTDCIAEA